MKPLACTFILLLAIGGCGRNPGPAELFSAIDAGDVQIVKRAVATPANVSARRAGWTPLHVILNLNETGRVSASARKEIVTLLVSAGADVNSQGGQGTSGLRPLDFAAVFDLLPEAEALLAHGADANAARRTDCRSIHYAVMAGNVDMVKLLLKHGADPNVKTFDALNSKGMNCLHLAARGRPRAKSETETIYETPSRQVEMIHDLLDAKTDAHALDAKGRTPLQVAEEFHQQEAATILRNLE